MQFSKEHITLYRSLFRGREDAYAFRWERKDGEAGYVPAREHKGGPYIPLADRPVAGHLTGKTAVGVYPLLQNGTTWFFAIDFDGKAGDPLADAQRVASFCREWSIPAYLERSRSGAGAHVWIFFSAPVPAWKPRLLASRVLLPEAGIEVGEQSSFDRFFPNQDRHTGKGLGNLIALPLQGERLRHGCTAFLDTSNGLAPFPDQWSFLASVQRVAEAKLDEMLREFDLSEKDTPQAPREAAPPDDEILRRMAGGIREHEGRDDAAYTIARRLAAKGLPQEEALALLQAWDQTNIPPLTQTDGSGILQEKVASAYKRQAEKAPSSSSSPPKGNGEREEHQITLIHRGAADLIQNAPEVTWLVEGILPIGRALMITGDAGTGKSWLGLSLALAVDQGALWLGHLPCRKGTVLIVDEENGDAIVKRRLQKALKGAGLPEDGSACGIRFMTMSGVDLSDEACVAEMDTVLTALGPELVVLDTYHSTHHADENSAAEIRVVNEVLKQWMVMHGTAFCLLHHNRKPGTGGDDSAHSYRGSSAIKGFVDSQLDMKTIKGQSGCATVRHVKSRAGEPVEAFGVEIVDVEEGATVVRYTEKQKSETQTRLEEAQEFILDLASTGEWISRQEILRKGAEGGHAKNTLDMARKLLVEAGDLKEEKDGKQAGIRLSEQPSGCSSPSQNPICGEEERWEDDEVELEEVEV